jgi:3-oxoacyl-[acyl-carrier-protein] synthase II
MNDSVVITGLGAITAAGAGLASMHRALIAGESGLGPLTRFPSPRCGGLPVAEVSAIQGGDGRRTRQLAETAIREALGSAGLPSIPEHLSTRAGLVIGTTVGGMPETESAIEAALLGRPVRSGVWRRHECGYLTSSLARKFGFRGPTTTVSTACASGALAIAIAGEWVASGQADLVVAGGTDALCRLTLNGFASLLALDPLGCRPFDRERRGTSLGEGAGFVVVESRGHARGRGALPAARLTGWAHSCDAYHATAPDPSGARAEEAVRGALDAARLRANEIDYINAHGTGTIENDRTEGSMLTRVFDRPSPVSSTKRIFGHTLGAAGAIEAIVCILAIRHGFVPGNPGFTTPDPECGLIPVSSTFEQRIRHAVSTSFGFGGNNSALVLSAETGP